MAGKKEYTKEEKIKKEKTRLKGIFKNLDENKKKLVTPLIEKAAFMSVEYRYIAGQYTEKRLDVGVSERREPVGRKAQRRGRHLYSAKQELYGSYKAINRACTSSRTQEKQVSTAARGIAPQSAV
ncbi:MAG: hypothetical protein ACLU90_05995 [Lachnospira sp.]